MIGFSRLVPRAVLVLIATIAFVHRLPGQERSKADHSSTFILRPGFRQIRKCTSRGPILRRDRFVWRNAPAKRRRHSCGSYRAPAVALAALAARAFARFATSAAFRAGDSLLFATAFFSAGFFACFVAWNAAQRFLVASEMAFLPAALILRFGFAVAVLDGGSASPLDAAQRFRCASPMRFRAAALIFRRLPFGTPGLATDSAGPPSSMAWSSAIWRSILVFCDSNPVMAAMMISFVSFVGMSTFRNHSR